MMPILMSKGKQTRQGRPPVLKHGRARSSFLNSAPGLHPIFYVLLILVLFSLSKTATPPVEATGGAATGKEPAGIREVIPGHFQKRYERWKAEYLSTGAGRAQWERYARDKSFTLTITVSEAKGGGAGTDQYRWDESGRLIAATITLGAQIDEGYPSPVNYPVISSLSHAGPYPGISGSMLAATKMAHEFGHVNRTAQTDAQLFQLQNRLIPTYNRILLSNGINVRDPRLLELSRQMTGTPVKIGQDRELWAEANALAYLKERCPDDGTYRPMFKAIRHAIEEYAKEHIERFR
jgi:hypothetical protein